MSFEDFLHDDGKYEAMLRAGEELLLDLHDIYDYSPDEAVNAVNSPDQWLKEHQIGKPIRFTRLIESTKIRDLATEHLGRLMQVECVVVTASLPDSTLIEARFRCGNCKETLVEPQDTHKLRKPSLCGHCKSRRGFELLVDESTYIDTQTLGLQERPEELPPGEVPEPLEATLTHGLVRSVTPGDRVRAVGIIRLKERRGRGLDFTRTLEVSHIEVYNRNPEESEITPEQEEHFEGLATRVDFEELLIDSYAPSIYGWRHVKKALLYAQFGGVRKYKGSLRIRGDINILMAGDPGTAKTQLLLFSSKASTRGVYSSGGGVTGVGLTAALVKDGDRYMLAAGTMALADMGIACIDELDKMNDEDRNKIHPAMEQGIIPIDKADVHATLNSRCAVIAACNPTDGRYNTYKTIPENVKKFPPSLLSRFDLIFIFLDEVNAERDRKMADRILQLDDVEHGKHLELAELRSYIAYAKRFNPSLPTPVKERLRDYFTEKRGQQQPDAGLFITPRQLESLERMTEARARMHLREEALMEDADAAIEMFEIFINETCHDPYTGKVDVDMIGGIPKSLRDQSNRVPLVLELMLGDLNGSRDYVYLSALEEWLMEHWNVPEQRARDVVGLAISKDLIWQPYMDHVKLSNT